MTDRELLELAAKAAGFLNWTPYNTGLFVETGHSRGSTGYHWNPLTDDGDALRLAVRLGLDILFTPEDVEVIADQHAKEDGGEMVVPWAWEKLEGDPYAATRRAIVRAAAEIGKEMK